MRDNYNEECKDKDKMIDELRNIIKQNEADRIEQ